MLISRLDPAAKGSDLEDVLIKSLETLKENKDSGEKIQNTKDYGTTAIGITGITKAYRKYQKRERQEIFERESLYLPNAHFWSLPLLPATACTEEKGRVKEEESTLVLILPHTIPMQKVYFSLLVSFLDPFTNSISNQITDLKLAESLGGLKTLRSWIHEPIKGYMLLFQRNRLN